MIRMATRFDIASITDMMRQFRVESPVADIYGEDEAHFVQLLNNMIAGQGGVFYAPDKGFLLGMILPSIWSPSVRAMHELAWYVTPEHRGGTAGHRLLKAYIAHGKALKEAGRIKYFTISKMVSSPDLKYGQFGFRKVDENWIQ